MNFAYGFLTAWTWIAVLALVADKDRHSGLNLDRGYASYIIVAPVFFPVLVVNRIYRLVRRLFFKIKKVIVKGK